MSRVKGASDALGDTFHRIDELLSRNEDRITRVIHESDETLEILKSTLNNTNDIIGDKETRQAIPRRHHPVPQDARRMPARPPSRWATP